MRQLLGDNAKTLQQAVCRERENNDAASLAGKSGIKKKERTKPTSHGGEGGEFSSH